MHLFTWLPHYTAQTRTHPECILFTGQHQHATIHTMKSKNMKMRMYFDLDWGFDGLCNSYPGGPVRVCTDETLCSARPPL